MSPFIMSLRWGMEECFILMKVVALMPLKLYLMKIKPTRKVELHMFKETQYLIAHNARCQEIKPNSQALYSLQEMKI